MTDLIKQVGGIGKAKKIIAEMPEYAVIYNTIFYQYFNELTGEYDDIILDDLRTAIADYDLSNNHQKVSNCNESENIVKDGKSGNFIKIETDYVTDITNHISPSTEVIER